MNSILARDIYFLDTPPSREYRYKWVKIGNKVFCAYEDGAIWDIGENRWRSPTIDREGYRVLSLGGKTCKLHRLILMVFCRAPNRGEQARHLDGDPSNNSITNLEWGTGRQNWEDRREHGRIGAEWRRLLTNKQALLIYNDPRPENDIAKEYNIQRLCVILIKEKRTYLEIHNEPV